MIVRTVLLSAMILGSVASANAGTFTFSNTNTIVINDSDSPPTAAAPYPSTNVVSGLNGSISKVTVSLYGFAHTFPSDVDIVLVGPGGQNAIAMSNVGGSTTKMPVTNIDLTLDDDASAYLPVTNALVSGTFKPTQGDPNPFLFNFPPPAPPTAQLMGPHLSNFKNTDPNGTWSLYVVDDSGGDSGVITGGWSLTISTPPEVLSIKQQQTNSILSWPDAGYTLQASPSLTGTWTNVNVVPVDVKGFFTVTNPATAPRLFYRLMQ